MQWIYLGVAILAEIIATSALKAADGFSRLIPTVIVVVGYIIAFYFLALTLRTMPLGIAYAIWSAVGISLIAMIGWFFYGQSLDTPAIIGLMLITSGVVIINGFSQSISH